jgi:predicted MPP superfamily phosphohydrolase
MITRLKAHRGAIILTLSVWAFTIVLAIVNWDEGISFFILFSAISLLIVSSQVFWVRRVGALGTRFVKHRKWRIVSGTLGLLAYLFLLAFSIVGHADKGSRMTLRAGLEVLFSLWFVGSVLGFVVVLVCGTVAKASCWAFKKFITTAEPPLPSPGRRRFLQQTAVTLGATPFVAGTYGFFYGRLNLEITYQKLRLRRLPKAFEGFRIVQLSDLHISPFMPAEEIRKFVAIANERKGDLVALTGDFLLYDGAAQPTIVQVLAALKAPFGVFGCMGNHEYLTRTEESIVRLFAGEHIRILRQERTAIQSDGDSLNLIGVDYEQRRFSADHDGHLVDRYMQSCEELVIPNTTNILLNHNPNAFDRAAELGIDLMLAGHTHGGQLSLEMAHRGLCLSRLATPYVSGWYEKAGSQAYVNRGIGTISPPIRVGARPEITVFELRRET